MAPCLAIHPPLINSSNPWATTATDLSALYSCPSTGAVTVRTSLLEGFAHDEAVHQYAFFKAQSHGVVEAAQAEQRNGQNSGNRATAVHAAAAAAADSSLNTLGYSPVPLGEYLHIVTNVIAAERDIRQTKRASGNGAGAAVSYAKKPFIISVTGTPAEIVQCRRLIRDTARRIEHPLYMEINLSCPNIPGKAPPAYDGPHLAQYLAALQGEDADADANPQADAAAVPTGIKLPPYTYMDQFTTVVAALLVSADTPAGCPIAFITSTNTLGSSLLLSPSPAPTPTSSSSLEAKIQAKTHVPALAVTADTSSTGIGGLAGASIHPLSLGNVSTLRRLLDESGSDALRRIEIIGIGGVSDGAGFDRMRAAGASVVGVGTALGIAGVSVFDAILGAAKSLA